jgi:hypothetical protein
MEPPPPAKRRLFLAQMDLDITSPEQRDLHAVLSGLHQKLIEIHGDDSNEPGLT